MPGDPKACREHAKRCWALASEITNPVLKESLIDTAQRWARLAVDLEAIHSLLEQTGWRIEESRLAAFGTLCLVGCSLRRIGVTLAHLTPSSNANALTRL
jgi:hypothetical protein